MDLAITIALFSAAFMWLLFSGWYVLRAKWWKSSFGWNTLGVSVLLSAIFTRLAVLVLHPSFTADLQWFGFVFYAGAAILGGHRIFLLEKAQRSPLQHRRSTDR